MPGQAVMGAAESGTSFPLKKRDQLLDYILTLMGHDDEDVFSDSSRELLCTQVFIMVFFLTINISLSLCDDIYVLMVVYHFSLSL